MSSEGKGEVKGESKIGSKWGWGRTKPEVGEVLAYRSFPWLYLGIAVLVVPAYLEFFFIGLKFTFWSFIFYLILTAVLALPLFAVTMFVHSRLSDSKVALNQDVIIWTDKAFEAEWKGKKIPIEILYEAYFALKVDFKGDILNDVLYRRYEFSNFVITMGHVKFFVMQFLPELIKHTKKQDNEQVTEHYDRGNDFYKAFLGETMVYTSGIWQTENDTLEEAQINKINLICNKIHLKAGEKHLDIGCGWGTFIKHAAKEFGSISTGITLSINQTTYGNAEIKKVGLGPKNAESKVMDYRDLPPNEKYNKITCLEMAEHVGVRKFGAFMRQVYDLLEDDGVFYLQIAGLRRPWQYEDLNWGLFMAKYVFPGADASCPLAWVIDQAEGAGFEIHTSETIGIHYSATIKRWYENWNKPENRKMITEKKEYGEVWWRKWAWFLGWSVIAPEQGSATCYQIVMHKNIRNFDRKRYIAERANYKI